METNQVTKTGHLDKFIVGSVPTVIYIPNFIGDTEEEQIAKNIYGAPVSKWKSLKNRRLQNWGGVVHEKGLIAQDLPPWLTRITQRIQEETGLFPSAINHVLINEYLPDQGIMPHQDGPAYYPVVAILSLGSPVVMDFTLHPNLRSSTESSTNKIDDKVHEEGGTETNGGERLDDCHSFSILLMPRSLLIFKDKAYAEYLHGIKDSEMQRCDRAVNVKDGGLVGPLSDSGRVVDGKGGVDDSVIHRTSTRLSLTCRVVTKVHTEPSFPLFLRREENNALYPSFTFRRSPAGVSANSPAMHETELGDLSDDADYAASMQQGSATMTRNDSTNSRQSSSSEPDGAEIVYLKDNVTIHPTQYASERISGRLKLIKQGNSLFMTWIPYKGQSSSARLSEKDRNLYTIRAVPFSGVRSIRRHTPTLGWQYVIVVLSSGLAFPPLYFYNGGVREFLATVKQHVVLARSAEDSNVFLVNDFQDPLQRTLSSLELSRAVSVAGSASFSVAASESQFSGADGEASDRTSAYAEQSGRPRQKHNDPARDLSINVLEKFSLVTRFAREATSQLFHETYSDSFISNERKKNDQSRLDYPHTTSDVAQNVLEAIPIPSDPVEIEKLSLVWGKPRQPPLRSEEWVSFLDSEGRVLDPQALRKRIFYGGVEHNLRKEVWAFLLGYHSYDSTYAEREYLVSVKKSEYETIKNQWKSISREQAKRFTKFRERKGLIEKDVVRTDRTLPFYDGDENLNVNLLHDILLTYSFYNFDLGYCQGMSDLLSPILYVMEDESESFWCFVALMERLGPNFNRDQNGMHSQLFALCKLVELLDSPLHNYFNQKDCLNYFFCFRWILIQFKREFEFEKTMRLWEVLWTHYLSEHLHLYVCVAVLKRYRSKIIGEQMDFDTLLKFINELSGHIELDSTIRDAEALCICAGENGAAAIPPGTPPSLPVEDASIYTQHDDDVL